MGCDPLEFAAMRGIHREGAMSAERAAELIGEHVQGVTLNGEGIAGRLLAVDDDATIVIGNGFYLRKKVRLGGYFWLWHENGAWHVDNGLPLGERRARY